MSGFSGLKVSFFSAFFPEAKLPLSQWADEHFFLSSESSASGGKWRTLPYQREIMDAITDPEVEEVWVQKSARVGFTKILNITTAYFIARERAAVMMVQPTIEDAEGYSKEEIAPMLDDVPILRDIAPEKKAKNAKETILHKIFKNKGSLSMVGANSPRGFRRVSRRIVLFDEVSGYPASAGAEGDQITLGKRRAEYFWNRKFVGGSTPTFEGDRICMQMDRTDKRRLFVPCPLCQTVQTLTWERMEWDGDDPATVRYICEQGCRIEPRWKRWMIERGEWRPTAPGNPGVRGYYLWAAYSFSPNADWPDLVREFLDAKKDPRLYQTFVNTVLGLPFDPRALEDLQSEGLLKRREEYGAQVPFGVAVLTAGVDVQDDRLEWLIMGWGSSGQSWQIERGVILGNTQLERTWFDLSTVLMGTWKHAGGADLPLSLSLVDSGGHATKQAMAFCRAHRDHWVFPVKGASRPLPKPVQRSAKRSRLWLVDTVQLKDILFSRLRVEVPGPGYVHFPAWANKEWLDQILSEKVVRRRVGGIDRRSYEKITPNARNEALDLMVYALAAFELLDPRDLAERLAALGGPAPLRSETASSPPLPLPPDPGVLQSPEPVQPRHKPPRLPRGGGNFGWKKGSGHW